MRAILFTGTLGSGKTTLIARVLQANVQRGGRKPVLIVNDVGKFNVDRGRLEGTEALDSVMDMTSGCLDCADRKAFTAAVTQTVADEHDLFVEPTGAANGDNLTEIFGECGIKPLIVTLLSAAHFRRNRAYDAKAMESQVRHADIIGISWWEHLGITSLEDSQLDDVLTYIGHHAPKASVYLVGSESIPSDMLEHMLSSEADAITSHRCGHECDHEHHHGHGHGHMHSHVTTIRLFPEASRTVVEGTCEMLEQHFGLVRAKGMLIDENSRKRFDFVHGNFTVSPGTEIEPYANFITIKPVPKAALGMIGDAHMEDAPITTEDVVAAVEYGLQNAWEARMPNGDIREDNAFLFRAYHRCQQHDVPDDLRNEVIRRYTDWYLEVAQLLVKRDWGNHHKLPQWRRRVGVHLTLLAVRHPDVLGEERVRQSADLRMATTAMHGLLAFRPEDLSFKADPVETPSDLFEVARFGQEQEQLGFDLILSAFSHCRSLSREMAWTARWDRVMKQFS